MGPDHGIQLSLGGYHGIYAGTYHGIQWSLDGYHGI